MGEEEVDGGGAESVVMVPVQREGAGGRRGETEREREKRTGRRGRRGVGTQSASNGVKALACGASGQSEKLVLKEQFTPK